jgi:hypothetical protein
MIEMQTHLHGYSKLVLITFLPLKWLNKIYFDFRHFLLYYAGFWSNSNDKFNYSEFSSKGHPNTVRTLYTNLKKVNEMSSVKDVAPIRVRRPRPHESFSP